MKLRTSLLPCYISLHRCVNNNVIICTKHVVINTIFLVNLLSFICNLTQNKHNGKSCQRDKKQFSFCGISKDAKQNQVTSGLMYSPIYSTTCSFRSMFSMAKTPQAWIVDFSNFNFFVLKDKLLTRRSAWSD